MLEESKNAKTMLFGKKYQKITKRPASSYKRTFCTSFVALKIFH